MGWDENWCGGGTLLKGLKLQRQFSLTAFEFLLFKLYQDSTQKYRNRITSVGSSESKKLSVQIYSR